IVGGSDGTRGADRLGCRGRHSVEYGATPISPRPRLERSLLRMPSVSVERLLPEGAVPEYPELGGLLVPDPSIHGLRRVGGATGWRGSYSYQLWVRLLDGVVRSP